jgi:hypothetical protein
MGIGGNELTLNVNHKPKIDMRMTPTRANGLPFPKGVGQRREDSEAAKELMAKFDDSHEVHDDGFDPVSNMNVAQPGKTPPRKKGLNKKDDPMASIVNDSIRDPTPQGTLQGAGALPPIAAAPTTDIQAVVEEADDALSKKADSKRSSKRVKKKVKVKKKKFKGGGHFIEEDFEVLQ